MSPALQQPTYEKSIFQSPFANPSAAATPTSDTAGMYVMWCDTGDSEGMKQREKARLGW